MEILKKNEIKKFNNINFFIINQNYMDLESSTQFSYECGNTCLDSSITKSKKIKRFKKITQEQKTLLLDKFFFKNEKIKKVHLYKKKNY